MPYAGVVRAVALVAHIVAATASRPPAAAAAPDWTALGSEAGALLSQYLKIDTRATSTLASKATA